MTVVLELLLILVVFAALCVGAVLLFLAFGARSLQRANRISPRTPTQVPVLWRWSIGVSARLHRRLQRVAALARASGAASGLGSIGIGELASDVERQACALDDHLALARHLPTSQRVRRLFELERGVAELEQLALRVTVLAGQVSSGVAETTIPLSERIGHLEAAVAEVRRIEADALGEARSLTSDPYRTLPAAPAPVTEVRTADPEPARLQRREG